MRSLIKVSPEKNALLNGFSQLVSVALSILVLPVYFRNLGAEAYGLIAFFTLLQSWFSLLDLGISPTVSRETASWRSGVLSDLAYRNLVGTLMGVFIAIGFLGLSLLLFFSDYVASTWIRAEQIEKDVLADLLLLILVAVFIRWGSAFFRGVVLGAEKLHYLSFIHLIISGFRYPGALLIMSVLGFELYIFFYYALAVGVFEFLLIFLCAVKVAHLKYFIPRFSKFGNARIRRSLKFSLSLGFTSSIWVLITQSDKLVLSGILPLATYGYYSLAVVGAATVILLGTSIGSAVMPRLSTLYDEGGAKLLLPQVKRFTNFATSLILPLSFTSAAFSREIFYLWTGDEDLVAVTAPIFSIYVLGNAMLALSAFAYYVQFAVRNLRYHVIGNLVMLLLLVPGIIVFSNLYGVLGAAWVWFSTNLFFLFVWCSFVMARFLGAFWFTWLSRDVMVPILLVGLLSIVSRTISGFFALAHIENLLVAFLTFGLSTVILILVNAEQRGVVYRRFFSVGTHELR